MSRFVACSTITAVTILFWSAVKVSCFHILWLVLVGCLYFGVPWRSVVSIHCSSKLFEGNKCFKNYLRVPFSVTRARELRFLFLRSIKLFLYNSVIFRPCVCPYFGGVWKTSPGSLDEWKLTPSNTLHILSINNWLEMLRLFWLQTAENSVGKKSCQF